MYGYAHTIQAKSPPAISGYLILPPLTSIAAGGIVQEFWHYLSFLPRSTREKAPFAQSLPSGGDARAAATQNPMNILSHRDGIFRRSPRRAPERPNSKLVISSPYRASTATCPSLIQHFARCCSLHTATVAVALAVVVTIVHTEE